MHFTETRISAPTITSAERISNDMAVVTFDPQDEVTADLFIVDYYLATDLETSNLVIIPSKSTIMSLLSQWYYNQNLMCVCVLHFFPAV